MKRINIKLLNIRHALFGTPAMKVMARKINSASFITGDSLFSLEIMAALLLLSVFILWKMHLKARKAVQVIHFNNKSIQQLSTEKEWLQREIHHRVKNNL